MGDRLTNTMETVLVRKKNGTLEPFDIEKIAAAAKKAFLSVSCPEEEAEQDSWIVASDVERSLIGRCVNEVHREDIHDEVQIAMMNVNKHAAAAYIAYRTNRRINHGTIDTLITAVRSITAETNRDNANMSNSASTKMAQIASEANKHYALNYILPKDIAEAHIRGAVHIHDLDYFSIAPNCLTFDAGKLLKDGFHMPYGFIREPRSIGAATALLAIAMQSVQNNQLTLSCF